MPDQVHMIWRLYGDDQDYSNRWRKIKSAFSRHLPAPPDLSDVQKTRGEKGIWQRRFWEHCIRDQADLLAHRDYIWRSPVAAGLVARPTDWEHSSIHRAMARGTSDSHWEKTRYGAVARTGGDSRVGACKVGHDPPYPYRSIVISPSFSAARDWQRIIAVLRPAEDKTKSRCSTSPFSTVHLHTPHRPSEHFTST